MIHANEEEIKREINRSRKALKAAEILYKARLNEDAISRSYYTILHAAKAVLLFEDIKVDSHGAVKKLFSLHFIKSGKLDAEYSRILREEQDDRLQAEYDVSFVPEKDQVLKRIDDARLFLQTMVGYLNKHDFHF